MRTTERISFRLIIIFVVVTTVLVAAFGALGYQNSKSSMEKQLNESVERALTRLQIGLPAPIWNFDAKQLDILLDAEMGDAALSGIMVQNAKKEFSAGRVRGGDGKSVAASATSQPAGNKVSQPLTYDDSGQKKTVGVVDVYVSHAQIDAALAAELRAVILQVLVLDIALVLVLIFSLRAVVLDSLNRVRLALDEIASGDADLTRRLRVAREDEVGEVARLFNVFVERLQGVIRQVRESSHSLDHATKEIASGNMDLSSRTERQASSLELQPLTGRSHQLRLHLQALGHPILGDALYAPAPVQAMAARLHLHARDLTLAHPRTGQSLQWHCPAPF